MNEEDFLDLQDKFGETYKQIGKRIGLSESFICRVYLGKRNLTLEHLVKIEKSYQIPLPVILLEATKQRDVPKELRPLYKDVREALKSAVEFQKIFRK